MKTYLYKLLKVGLLLVLCLGVVPVWAAPEPPDRPAPALHPPHIVLLAPPVAEQSAPSAFVITAPTTEWTLHKTADNAHPDGNEQQTVWLMNRARANPPQEGIWLATSTDPDIASGRTYFNVDVTLLQNEFAGYTAKPPAAFDVRLYNAAKAHSDDLIARDAQDHTGQFDRITAAGFVYNSGRGSVFSYADSSLNAHAAWNIDWGYGAGGMQDNRGHRKAIMSLDGDYTNVGLALVYENNPDTNVGLYVSTGNYCHAGTAADHYNRFLVGTVWDDQDGDSVYDPGEGIGGVTVMPNTGAYYAVTANSGGYAIPITAPGEYVVTFSGAASAVKTVTIGDVSVLLDLLTTAPAAPAAPTNLSVALTAQTAITLTWTDASDNEDGFKIERSLDGSSGWTQVGTVGANVATYADTGLTCNTPYYYRARAYNAAGDSAYSNVANGTTAACPLTPPATPTNLTVALVSQTAITLTWTDASDNEAGFKIERSPDGSSGWAQVGTVGANVTTYVNSGLTPATPYFYRVLAYNTGGDSAYSNVANGVTAAPPPLSLTKTRDTGGLTRVPLGGVVTYTLTITNNTAETLSNVALTDVLPTAVSFRAWIGHTGSGVLPPPGTVELPPLGVVWQPGDLAGGGVLTLAFSVNVTTSAAFAGHTVVNTAQVGADEAAPATGSASFRIQGGQSVIYLPLVIRNWPPTYAISGVVTDGAGAGLAGVVISDGAGHSATTDANGAYTLRVLAGSYTFTASKSGYEFTPPSFAVTVPPDASGQNFVGAVDLQRLVVFEGFFRPGCGYCEAAAGVVRDQLVPEYADRPVLFLEYNLDAGDPREYRWWDGYAVGGMVGLPLTMVDSGDQVTTGLASSAPGGFYGAFKGMLDAALAVPDGQAAISATAQRNGNHVTANVQVTNRGSLTLGAANRATVWLLVYEDFDAAPVEGVRLTKQYVRATVSQAIATDMAPNATQIFTLDTADLSEVDWNRLHAVVIVDYQPNPTARPYDTYQAVAVPVTP